MDRTHDLLVQGTPHGLVREGYEWEDCPRWRVKLARWLLKPRWVPMLEHYSETADTHRANKDDRAVACDYIAIGIKHALDL